MINVNGYIIEEWKTSTGGQIAFATRYDKRYFIKKYQSPVKPDRSHAGMSDARYTKDTNKFNNFIEYRKKINETLKAISGPGGNIIAPVDSFVYEQRFVEVCEYVADLVSTDELKKEPYESRLTILMLGAKALADVHNRNVIHGDLKTTNVVVTKSSSGLLKAKLIDFDCSYFSNVTYHGDIGGDQIFLAPEVGAYLLSELDPEYATKLSVKADIYSLGLVLHEYLVNELPKIEVKPADCTPDPYLWEVLLFGGKIKISNAIKDGYVKNLITSMLQLDPTKRPTALEVFEGLKSKKWPLGPVREDPIPIPTPKEKKVTPGFDELWPEHHYVIDKEEVKKQKIIAFRRKQSGSIKGYEAFYENNTSRKANVNTWVAYGILKVKTESKVEAPIVPAVETPLWPEDNMYELIESAFLADGFTKIIPVDNKGRHCYALYVGDTLKQYKLISHLLLMGYARKK